MNSGKDSDLIAQIQVEHDWILFVWCFSYRLELALKDALSDLTSPADESFMHSYYLYQKSSKKLRELKCLYQAIKGDFEMYGEGMKPLKATGTRWIDHRIRAMGRLVDKVAVHEITAGHRSLSDTISCVTDRICFLPVTMTGRFSNFNSI